MTTRLYLDATADTVPITPTPSADWEDTSLLARVLCAVTPSGESMSTVNFSDSDTTTKDILFRQHISPILTTGQSIAGTGTLKAQCRVSESFIANNMLFAVGIRVIAADGTTVQSVISTVFQDNVEADATTLTNRRWTRAASATYTTQAGDRLVVEIGMRGTPGGSGSHTSAMRLGSASGTDLGENDTDTADNNPWVEIPDTLTFISGTNWTDTEADTVTLADAETANPVSAQADSVTVTDASDTKTFVKALADTVTMSDQAETPSTHFKALSDSLTISDAAGQAVLLALADTLSVTDTIVKKITVARSDIPLLSDIMTRSLHLDDTLTLASAVGAENPDTSLVFKQLPAFFGTIR